MFFKKRKTYVDIFRYAQGEIVTLENVPDPVFSQKMMGDGLAISVTESAIVSPVDGTVTMVFPTKHALGITTSEGVEILLHIGIDTVQLKGEGFEVLVTEGDVVHVGDALMSIDVDKIIEAGKSLVSPLIITSTHQFMLLDDNETAIAKVIL